MRTSAEKKATTLRFQAAVKAQLENAARVLGTSESQIAEAALLEYFKNHGLTTRYIMKASKSHYCLIKVAGESIDVLDRQIRNGVPMESIREGYIAKVNAPVSLEYSDEGALDD